MTEAVSPVTRRSRTGRPISTITDPRLDRESRFRSGTNCAAAARWRTPDRFQDGCLLSDRATTTVREIAYDIGAFFLAPGHRARRTGRDVSTVAADHLRSARAQARASKLLLPPFTPAGDEEAWSRGSAPSANELIDEFIADGKTCDAAVALHASTSRCAPIAHMLGMPEKDGDLFITLDPRDPRARHQATNRR